MNIKQLCLSTVSSYEEIVKRGEVPTVKMLLALAGLLVLSAAVAMLRPPCEMALGREVWR